MSSSHQDLYVSRKPIFTREKNIWGYEVTLNLCGEDGCDMMTSDAIQDPAFVAECLSIATGDIHSDKRICLDVDFHALLAEKFNEALPANGLVLDIPGVANAHSACESCRKSRQKVMLNDSFINSPDVSGLLENADYLRITFAGRKPKEIMSLRQSSRRYGCELLASEVIDWQEFEGGKALGFSLFQGSFFAKPENRTSRKLTSDQRTRMSLLSALSKEDVEIKELAELISTDAALSVRLLRFINSPAFGFRGAITSIPHAASLLGFRPLKSWTMAAILADMDSSEKGSAICYNCMVRAVFLKLMAENKLAAADPETMFLLGLLSNLDALVGLPMEEALSELSVADFIKDAFIRGEGWGTDWITLIRELEKGNMLNLQAMMKQLSLPARETASLFMKATSMAASTVEN